MAKLLRSTTALVQLLPLVSTKLISTRPHQLSRSIGFGLTYLSLAVLAACGGGGAETGGESAGVSSAGVSASPEASSSPDQTALSTRTTATTTAKPTIVLGNLPTNPTTSTSASITYTASSGTVYCRLDSYLPIACPKPFVLGATTASALSIGSHTVDYYLDTGAGIDLANPTATYTWTIQSATAPAPAPAPAPATTTPTVTLGNLPSNHTTSTSASISNTTTSGKIYCRLDSYTPVACPNPFVLGATADQALSVGTHSVNFYVDTGAGIDATKPTNSYTWTIDAPTSSTPTTTAPTTTTALASAFKTGPDYALEAPSDADSTSTSYAAKAYSNGTTVASSLSSLPTISRSGVVRLGPTTADGKSVIRHEVRNGDPLRNGGNRSELSYDDMQIQHGVDYWMSFAIKLDSDWTAANSAGSSDQQSFMQVHQQNSETTLTNGGPFGIKWRGVAGREIEVFSLGPNNSPVTRFTAASTAGTWMRFIVHYRSGVTTSQSPTLEVWQAVGTGASYTKLTDLAPGSLFGDPAQNLTRDWAKVGIYKWTSGYYGSTSKRGMYSSGLYFAKGTSLYNDAAAAVSGF